MLKELKVSSVKTIARIVNNPLTVGSRESLAGRPSTYKVNILKDVLIVFDIVV